MTHPPHSTKSLPPRDIDARARLFAEIAAECSARIFPGDYSEAGISAFAATIISEGLLLPPDGLPTPAEAASKPSKPRRPPLDSLLKQAAKAGKSVKGAEVYQDRTVLQFGDPTPVEPENPWPLDEFCTKETNNEIAEIRACVVR